LPWRTTSTFDEFPRYRTAYLSINLNLTKADAGEWQTQLKKAEARNN